MKFVPSPLAGVVLVEPDRGTDERGAFARMYEPQAFARAGLDVPLPLVARAWNHRAATLRGMHYQAAPHGETKLVSCARGAVFDVAVDLRAGSPTRGQWFGARLDADDGQALWVPAGCAHGYLTLTDEAVVLYQMTDNHRPDAERGVRWDDPTLAIAWPAAPAVISERDRSWPALTR